MAQASQRISRTVVLRRQAAAQFVGRREQLLLFAQNLDKDPNPDSGPDPAEFLFHVRGVGGVGKSTLLTQWREEAQRAGALTALVDDTDVQGPETALIALARQLARQAGPLKEFDRAVEQHRRVLQASAVVAPAQPPADDSTSLPARIAAQAVLGAASVLPGAGVVTAMASPDLLAQGADRIATGLRRRRPSRTPDEVMVSQAFVAELWHLCERRQHPWVVLFIDTWEQTGHYLDAWLRDALDGAFGELPLELIIVLAGRDELSEREWGPLRSSVVDVPLDVFTEQEAKDLLAARGVTDPGVVDAVLHLSMRLPLLVALLAQAHPDAADDVVLTGTDMVEQAVERFLYWIPDPGRRELVLAAALPQQLNYDLFTVAASDVGPSDWEWLLHQPFVSGRGDFKQYHAVVRTSMLRRRRTHAPQAWAQAHTRIARAHAAGRTAAERELPASSLWGNARWRQLLLDETYHRLCADPVGHLHLALEHTVRAAGEASATLTSWADMLAQAAADTEHAELARWAELLHSAGAAPQPVLETLSVLSVPGLPTRVRAWALTHRGRQLHSEDRGDEALADLDQAVAMAAGLPRALAYRGNLHSRHNRHSLALADLTAALALDPGDAWARARRGEAHREAGRLDEAVSDFTAALALNPHSEWTLAQRGQAHRKAGRLDEAVADFTAALALAPDYTWALASRGQTHRQAGHPDQAVADLTAALALSPAIVWMTCELVAAYRQNGQTDRARMMLDTVARLHGTEPAVRYQQAVTQLLEAGHPACVDAWEAFLTAPSGASEEPVEAAVRILLHGLVVRESEPDDLVRALLVVPAVHGQLNDILDQVRELAQAEPPVGTRAAAVASLLETGRGGEGPAAS